MLEADVEMARAKNYTAAVTDRVNAGTVFLTHSGNMMVSET